MPFSSEAGKASIAWALSRIPVPKTALDIGCGEGTYAKMFPKLQWTGVEIWEPYVEEYSLKDLYPSLQIADVREWDTDEHFDVCFLGDVLEHMTKEEAQLVVQKAKRWADTVVISIPLGHYPQGEYAGNPYETHIKDDWSDVQVKNAFGAPSWSDIDQEIGVYVYSKHEIRLRIAVYAISKNEKHFVERFCASAKDADVILIADTGSDDGTAEEAKRCGAHVASISINPWRFDHARNATLALIPRDIDVCISLDLDEVLEPGWREEIQRVWTPRTTRLRYYFDWGAGIRFKYEKIHARKGYFWHHPCHEYPVADGRITEVWADTDMLLVSHHPDPTKSRGQYLDLLALSVKEDPSCPRNAFYYARELTFHSRWHDAIRELHRYLALPGATWANERCYAYRLLGKSHVELGETWTGEKFYQLAASEAPGTREPWCELALIYYRQQRWPDCYAAAMRALEIKDKQLVYTCDPAVWGYWPHDLAAVSAWNMGMKDVALEQAKIAAALEPNDPRLQNNVRFMSVASEVPANGEAA